MAEPTRNAPPPATDAEALDVLLARLGRRSGPVPAVLVVDHVLRLVPATEWPTRVEALDAIVRRIEAVTRDGLRVEAAPAGGRALGPYATRGKSSGARPYATVLEGVDPVAGRCDCPDFLKNSLGLCKHLWVALDHLHRRPRKLAQAARERDERPGSTGLRWDPVRPLTGAGDWLERVGWSGPTSADRALRAARWFRPAGADTWVVKTGHAGSPAKRLELIEDLTRVLKSGRGGERSDPALAALVRSERERLRRVVAGAIGSAELRAALKGLKRPLYPYQRDGVRRFLDTGRLLLADDMGLGKTAQAIAACEVLWRTRRIRRGLVIAPAALKPQWAREWARFSDLEVRVVDGSPAERRGVYASQRSGVLVINYEQLLRDLDVVRDWQPDVVVLDEAQRIKNWATKTALSVKGLNPPYRLVLTGTPMENRIEELASVVEWVDDLALEPKWRLGAVHAVRADGHREVTGVRHLDTLRARLQGCMIRRVRQEVLDQLPPRTDSRVPVEMTEAQLGEHDALIQPIASLVKRALTRPLTQAEFLRLMSLLTTQRVISNGLAQLNFEEVWPAVKSRTPDESLLQTLAAPKLLELRQLVRQVALDQGRKVVVFSQWRRMLTLAHWAVGDLLRGDGLRAAFFTGAEGQRRRTQNLVEFHDDPGVRILFASDAGGVGLNLQRAANCVVNLELPWNPAVLEQRVGRVYRLGQTQPIDVFNLVCEQGIEARIAGLVGSKQAFFKGLFDGESDTVQFEQSGGFLARVQKLYGDVAAGADPHTDAAVEDTAEPVLDDEVDDPFAPVVEAADEAEDQSATVAGEETIPEPAATPPTPPEPSALPRPHEVRRLFSQLQIRQEADGRVVIEAAPEAASTLSALFEGMAALLRTAAPTDRPAPPES